VINDFFIIVGGVNIVKVLLPVDGSENSLRAAEFLAQWMQRESAIETTIIAVANIGREYLEMLGMEDRYEEILNKELQPILEKAKKVFEARGLRVETIIGDGEPAEIIAKVVKEGDFDHVVMGRRGMGGIKVLLLGSVTQKVLQLVDCPVTLIK